MGTTSIYGARRNADPWATVQFIKSETETVSQMILLPTNLWVIDDLLDMLSRIA